MPSIYFAWCHFIPAKYNNLGSQYQNSCIWCNITLEKVYFYNFYSEVPFRIIPYAFQAFPTQKILSYSKCSPFHSLHHNINPRIAYCLFHTQPFQSMASRSVTLAVACVLSLFSLVSIIYPEAVGILALIPANLLITHNYAWNLVSCCFLQVNIVRLSVDALLLFIISYEVNWAPLDQFGLYFVLSIVFSSIGTLLELLYRFYISNAEAYLLEATYGCGGVIMCLMMYIRQQLKGKPVIPQYPVVTFHHLPTLFLTVFTVLFLAGEKFLTRDISFMWISYFYSWVYLRFFYKYPVSLFVHSQHILCTLPCYNVSPARCLLV